MKKARNLRTSLGMKFPWTLLAWATLALGAAHIRKHVIRKRKEADRLQVWEAEGGAVPLDDHRTATQVAPRMAPALSPGRDA